jgi:hypothetical protein
MREKTEGEEICDILEDRFRVRSVDGEVVDLEEEEGRVIVTAVQDRLDSDFVREFEKLTQQYGFAMGYRVKAHEGNLIVEYDFHIGRW